MAATKASPATEEPVKRTATKSAVKRAVTTKAAPAKKATKSTARATKAEPDTTTKSRATKSAADKPRAPRAKAADGPGRPKKGAQDAEAGVDVAEELDATDELEAEPEVLDVDDADLDLEDLEVDATAEDEAEGDAAAKKPAAVAVPGPADEEEIAEPSEKDKASGDFVWDEEESEALRQARKDAELTASADSVRAYLKQIGKVALLNAEEEVELAKRIEAGLYCTQLDDGVRGEGREADHGAAPRLPVDLP